MFPTTIHIEFVKMYKFVVGVLFERGFQSIKTRKGERRIFPFLNLRNAVFACGLRVTYINERGQRRTLYVEETNPETHTCYTSDFGGKVDLGDTCLFDTLSREVWEESSHKFFGEEMDLEAFRELFKTFLDSSGVSLRYIPESKYLLVNVNCDRRLPEECGGLVDAPLTRFDRMEGCISRKFFWVNSWDVNKITNFHPRLQQQKMTQGRQQQKKYQGRQKRKMAQGRQQRKTGQGSSVMEEDTK